MDLQGGVCQLDGKTERDYPCRWNQRHQLKSDNLCLPERLAYAIRASSMNCVPAFVESVGVHAST